jgi:hypothetical protein
VQKRFRGVRRSHAKPAAVAFLIAVVKQPPPPSGTRYTVFPAGPVVPRPVKYRPPFRLTRIEIVVPETGRRDASTAFAVTRSTRLFPRYWIGPIERRPGVTLTVAVPDTDPFGVDAVSVPWPSTRPVVRVTVGPVLGDTTPTVRGETDQVAETGTRLPNESTPDAV